MTDYWRKIGRVSLPILVHMGISFAVVYAGTLVCMVRRVEGPDVTWMTVLSAAASFPVLWRMWKKDRSCVPGFIPERKQAWWFYLLAFGCGMLASCLGSFLLSAGGAYDVFSRQVQQELFAGNLLLQIVGLGMVTPVVEEVIFRGLFYQRLRESVPRGWSIGLTALIFALWHQDPLQMIYAFPMGLLMQLFYEKCGSLIAPILFHMGANLISIVVEYCI